jgi:hypothetical protein
MRFFLLGVTVLGTWLCSSAFAVTVTDTVTITPGDPGAGTTEGYLASSYGSAVPSTTSDAYPYAQITVQPGRCKPNGCTPGTNLVSVSGFSSDPGTSWLTSVSWNNCTLTEAASTYAYINGLARWSWPETCDFGAEGTPVQVAVVHTLDTSGSNGWITPKYQVVGITYAPPGSKSTATYANGFLSGTANSSSQSVKTGVTTTDTLSTGFDLFGVLGSKEMQTFSAGWTQTSSSSNSVTVAQQYSTGLVVPGPPSASLGVDHDYDTVFVWLNPAIQMTIYGTRAVVFDGFNWDARDTITGMDVIGLTVGQLTGTQPISAATLGRLNRTWDPNLGALSSADYLAIAATDVFYTNPGFNPNTDTSNRFEQPGGNDLIFNYVPSSGQPVQQTFTSSYTSTSVAGQSASQDYTVGYSIEGGANGAFIIALSGALKFSSSLTYTNSWSSTVTNGTTQTANFTIVGPVAADNYTGPTAVQVWKDNIYGTFMFYPEN